MQMIIGCSPSISLSYTAYYKFEASNLELLNHKLQKSNNTVIIEDT